MLIDIIFLLLMVYAIFKGITRGFIVAVFSFFAFYIGLAAALKFSAVVAEHLHEKFAVTSYWLPLICFAMVFIGVVLVVKVGATILKKVSGIVLLGWLDSVAGILLFAAMYLMIYSVILFYATRIQLISQPTQKASVTYFFVGPIGPQVIAFLGNIIPFFSDMFSQLTAFFEDVANRSK